VRVVSLLANDRRSTLRGSTAEEAGISKDIARGGRGEGGPANREDSGKREICFQGSCDSYSERGSQEGLF